MCTRDAQIFVYDFVKKVDQQKMEKELGEEYNNMTQGNDDHQQILWHGNKRKKYARIVFSEQTLRMCRCKRGKLQIP